MFVALASAMVLPGLMQQMKHEAACARAIELASELADKLGIVVPKPPEDETPDEDKEAGQHE